MLITQILGISFAAANAIQLPDLPVVEVSGEGNYIEPASIVRMIRAARPNKIEPVRLSNDGIVFFDLPDRYIYFDPSFRSLRVLFAKQFIVDRMIQGGFHPVIAYSEMSPYLAKEFYIRVRRAIPESTILSNSAAVIETHMDSSIKLSGNTVQFQQEPDSKPTLEEQSAIQTLPKNFVINPRSHLIPPPMGKLYARIFSGTVISTPLDTQRDRKILQLFAAWAKKQNDDMDQKLFRAGEEQQAWSGLTEFLRSKTLAEVAHTSPSTYSKIAANLLDNYQTFGFNDSDAMRNALNSAPIATTSGFQIKFYDNHGSVFTLPFP